MASFTEQATLRVVDQSSSKLRKINTELGKLLATARSMKSLKVNIDITGLAAAKSEVRQLTTALRKLKSVRADPRVDLSGITKAVTEIHKLTSAVRQLNASQVRLHTNTSGLAQAQNRLNALRTSAARPITVGTFVGYGAAAAAARGVGRAAKEGTQDVDVAKTTIEMLQLDKGGYAGRRQAADEAIDRVMTTLKGMPGPQQFNRGLVAQRFAESLLQVREGEAAEALRIPLVTGKPWLGTRAANAEEKKAESLRRMNQAQLRTEEELNIADIIAKRSPGMEPRQAIGKVAGYFKAMDQAGWLTDDAGNFDAEGLQKAGTFVRRMIGMVGEEATGRFMHTLFKREKGAKFSLNERGQLMAAIVAEDMDPATAGTALSSWMRQTQGQGITKAAMAERVKAGMATPIYGPQEYTKKGKPKQRKITGYNVKGAELAMTDPLRYANEVLIPGLQKMGLTMEQIYSGDDKDIAKVKFALDKLHSNVNAAQFAQILITKGDEINKQIIDAYTRDASQQASREASKLSVGAAVNTITGQFKGMLGEAVVAFAEPIAGVATGVGNFFKENADEIRRIHETGDWGAIAALSLKAGGAVAGAGAGFWAIRKAMQMSGAAGALGWGSGMLAMTTGDDATRALGGAGISLIEAADALKSAAATLANDPSLGPISPGDIGPDGKRRPPAPGGPPKPNTPPAGRQSILTRAGDLLRRGSGYVIGAAAAGASYVLAKVKTNPKLLLKGGGALTAAVLAHEFIDSLPDDRKTRVARSENRERAGTLQKQIKTAEQILAGMILQNAAKPNPRTQAAIDREVARVKGMRQELDRRLIEYEATRFGAKATPVKTTKHRDFTGDTIPGGLPPTPGGLQKAVTDGVDGAKPIKVIPYGAGATPTTPLPGSAPVLPGGLTPAETITRSLSAATPALIQVSTAVTTASKDLTTSAGTFGTTFNTGSEKIGAAGTTAANALTLAAPGIGKAIGDAAAGAIRGAVANLDVNVNVNQKSEGAPTGASTPGN